MGFKSSNALKILVIFHSTCSYDARLNVSLVTLHSPKNLQKEKKKIGFTKCFGMVSVKVFPSICLSSEQIRIFNQKMYKCSIVRDTI